METRLQKWGNSVGIRIPSNILKSLNLKTNDKIILEQEENKIIIKKYTVQFYVNISEASTMK